MTKQKRNRHKRYAANGSFFQVLPKSVEFFAVFELADLVKAITNGRGPRGEFIGNGGFYLDPFAGGRMGHAEPPGVEHEAGDLTGLPVRFAVDGVAEQGVAEEAVVDPDLMGAAGVEGAENERGAIGCGVEKMKIGDGWFADSGVADVHSLAMNGMAGDVVEDCLVGGLRRGLGDGEVKLAGAAISELADEVLEGLVGFSGDDATGGVLVEAVNDSRSSFSAFAGQLPGAVVKEGVDEGSIGITSGGMHDHSGGFVENNDFRIFKENGKREILGDEFFGFFLWNGNGDLITGFQGGPGLDHSAVQEDMPFLNQGLDSGA